MTPDRIVLTENSPKCYGNYSPSESAAPFATKIGRYARERDGFRIVFNLILASLARDENA